jgi:hypothetical protein
VSSPPPVGVGGLGGRLEARQHVVAEMDRLVDRLEAHRLLGQAGHRKDSAHGARRQHEDVVVEVDGRPLEEMDARPVRGVVDLLDLAHDQQGAAQHPAQGHDNVTGLDRA